MKHSAQARDRLQPSLLDRLQDDEPQALEEARGCSVHTRNQLRECVRRDLEHLLNARGGLDGLDSMPSRQAQALAQSVLAYGMPAMAGHTVSTLDIAALERQLTRLIARFEPRILPQTLEVKAQALALSRHAHNVIGLSIAGAVWASPSPLPFWVRIELDLETGQVHVPNDSGAV